MRRPPLLLSVIIPHYQDLQNLARCLESLERQTISRDRFEIIVADNCSPIGSAAVKEIVADRARLVQVREQGAGLARNGGVTVSSGQLLAFIDSDCVASPQWLEEGVKALEQFDFVGGRVDVSVAGERPTPTEAYEKVFAFDFDTYINRKGFTGSGNLFVPRRVFDAVGGFRNRVSEDVDWCRRAIELGYKLGYAPKAVVSHPARRNWSELRTKWVRINRETHALYLNRNWGRWRWLARSLFLPISAVVHSQRVLRSAKLSSTRERLGALAVLYRIRLWRFRDAMKLTLSR